MKVKTSVTLEQTLLKRIDKVLNPTESRSAFFLDAATQLAEKREREKREAKDVEILNAKSLELNHEALDNLALVADVFNKQGLEQP